MSCGQPAHVLRLSAIRGQIWRRETDKLCKSAMQVARTAKAGVFALKDSQGNLNVNSPRDATSASAVEHRWAAPQLLE